MLTGVDWQIWQIPYRLLCLREISVAIEFKCNSCQATLRVPDEHLGKQARCPKCQSLNVIQPDSNEDLFEKPSSANPFTGLASDISPPHSSPPDSRTAGSSSGTSNPYQPTAVRSRGYRVAHRGGLILTLGIFSIVCNMCLIPGIMAWVMGRADLNQIRAGVMDPDGEGLTQAGMIIGIIMTCFNGVIVLLYLGIVFLAIAMEGM